MKRIIIVFLALFLIAPLFSQEVNESNDGFKPGYKGILEFKGGLVHMPLGGKTGGIDHPSPVCSEQLVFTGIIKSLFADIEILTFR